MDPISRYEVRDELRRLLASKHFAKARKRSRFLEFVCEQALLGNSDKLNEYLIGVEAYGRGSDFNPQEDAIVRVQACEIRKSLRDYYADEGRDAPWRIDLPAGGYVPVFARVPAPQPASTGTRTETAPAPAPVRVSFLRRNALVLGLALGCAALLGLWVRERSAGKTAAVRAAAALPEGTEWFWKPFLPPAEPPLIVLPNHPLLRAAHDGDSPATMERSYLIPKEKVAEFRDTMHFRELRGFHFVPDTTDFTGVGEALGLMNLFEFFANAGQKTRIKAARWVDFESLKRGNAILLGGNQSWSGRIFLYPDGFWFHGGVITNKMPQAGERPVYRPEFDPVTNGLRRDYALVLMLPNENRDQRILLTYGIYTQGTQAAIEYISNPERLRELRSHLAALTPDKKSPPGFFQALLTTTVENGVPGKVSFVSARIIPQ